ncbi:phosphoadenosine phosphosulfate reductase family protein [Luteibacter sp. dw_328]|uniref:phosphoadenosine phosphosulfate reductase domain-containing protein n=1 Tax=Luteibacter sp. dw_328 TaxID=2719796 RepID=UPI001BD30A14|nr:phosphoadenosine phosphosulfate reductase family protein [Luteibacter sp. dw_328]
MMTHSSVADLRPGTAIQHLVNVSGGKDSTATYLKAMESGREFRAVFADTGNEHEATYEYVSRLAEPTGGPVVEVVRADFSRQLAIHRQTILTKWPAEGIADEIVAEAAALNTPSGNPYLDLCILKGRLPSRKAQFCTEELKQLPISSQVVGPMLRSGPVLQWLGIRADESANRAQQRRYNRHDDGSIVWRPIFRWSVEDVWAMHRKHGVLPNPLYAMGARRVGCWPCINCRKDEVRLIADMTPEHMDRIERWEAVVAAANKRRMATFFAPINGDILPIRNVIDWARTGRGGRQYDIFMQDQAGGGCTSDLGLCEREAA